MKSLRVLSSLLLLALFALPAGSDVTVPLTGNDPADLAMAMALHDYYERQLARRDFAMQAEVLTPKAVSVSQFDQVAVLEDDASLIVPPVPFDLSGRSIQFLHRPKGMSVVRSNLGFKELIGERLGLGDNDDVRVWFPAGFEFPFFEGTYSNVYVGSDGLLTFIPAQIPGPTPEPLLFGYPRIAAFLTDLDPSNRVTERTGVYVKFLNKRVRFTWLEVPLRTNAFRQVTAQVTLFDNGRIVFAYGDVEASRAIVGVFPGGHDSGLYQVDFRTELPLAPRRAAIFQAYMDHERLDLFSLVRTFYQHFEDRYDQLILWFEPPSSDGAGSLVVANDVHGIGVPIYDIAHAFGSEHLSNLVVMGSVHNYPDDPDADATRTYSTMDVLAREVGRRWLGPLRFRDADGVASLDLMGANLLDWSFHFDSDASFLGGNDIEEVSAGVFETVAASSRYCRLDQYLMGLIPPEEVAPFFYVDNASVMPADAPPMVGTTLEGDRVDLTVWDIIAVEGPRLPASAESPDFFRTAFVILAREGYPPSLASLEKLNQFRRRWVRFFSEATERKGRVGTALWPRQP